MIGSLPTALEIGVKLYPIRTDFRVVLNIYAAFNDPELTNQGKCYVCIKCLYEDYAHIPREHMQEAVDKAYWFVGGGDLYGGNDSKSKIKTMDWEQDEGMIFPAVNKVAGYETRSVPYLHWWAFLGLFNEIGDGLFSQVINIRLKKAKNKKLEKYEKEFYREHKDLIDIRRKRTAEEQADIDRINKLLG